MNVRHQEDHLRCVKRKNGLPRWEFVWRETGSSGRRIRRNAVIGTIEDYPTEALAQTIAAEKWLKELQRQDSKGLANSTRAKVRNLMSVLFNHAIRNEWLNKKESDHTLVRQSASR